MRIAYLDCFAGISGDMFLGALLDAGVPAEVLRGAVTALGLTATIEIETVDRSGISSKKITVLENGKPAEAPEHAHTHADGKHTHSHEAHEHSHEAPMPEPHGHSHEAHEHPHEAHKHEHPHEAHEHEHSHKVQAHSHEGHSHDEHGEHKHEHGEHKHEPHAHSHSHDEPKHSHVHGRSLTEIRKLILASSLAEPVKLRAIDTFEQLGHSEAKIHNVPVDQIHFHEVGAVDAIVDIVAASAGIEHLRGEGVTRWHASSVNMGGGMVVCAHGTFPVPAPATADLLRGMPTYSAHVEKELVTPTGAAILRTLDPKFGPQPAMRVSSIGYGAGSRNPKQFPNVLRLSIGEGDENHSAQKGSPNGELAATAIPLQSHSAHQSDMVTVLETALDDSSPQVLAYVAERALALGALDCMLTPVIMKKGRPGTLVTVLCNPPDAPALEDLLLRETSTLGVRMHREHRSCLDRGHTSVETKFGPIRIKVGTQADKTLNVAPEYEDCRTAAAKHNVALKQVMQAALAGYFTHTEVPSHAMAGSGALQL